MNGLDQLYQEIILDHQRDPRHFGEIEQADCRSEGFNPMCGDRVCVSLKFSPERKVLVEGKFSGEGCSICMASASMMMEEVNGRKVFDILDQVQSFRKSLTSDEGSEMEGDLAALAGVKRFPVRIKCALLPWTTLKEAVEKGCTAVLRLSHQEAESVAMPESKKEASS